MRGEHSTDRVVAPLFWPGALLVAGLFVVPFLFTAIAPLTDVPGHMGRFAVQTASAGDPLLRHFAFRWELTLNLASDAIIELVHPVVGVLPATWLLCAATPLLTVLGLVAIARRVNAAGADALPWAFLFAINYPLLWGFLNFSLTAALGLLAFAGWFALARWPGLRAAVFLLVTPLLLIGHGVAGLVSVGLIVAYTLGENVPLRSRAWMAGAARSVASVWPLLAGSVTACAVWKLWGAPSGGRTVWLLYRKGEALLMMVRDQSVLLDVGTVAAALVMAVLGWWRGARLGRGAAAAVLFIVVLFTATPSLISGSDRIDTRLAPLIPMLSFAMQDWSRTDARLRRAVMLAGLALLAVRLTVTTISFVNYDRRYRLELSALGHVPRGSRVLNLTRVDCVGSAWRSERLEHLASLATLFRNAWVNAHWAIDGLQLLEVRYRPSRAYFADPSQLVWPAACVDFSQPFAQRDRHTLGESLPKLPLGGVDYLWLIGEHLPTSHDPRLRRVWADDISELDAVRPRR